MKTGRKFQLYPSQAQAKILRQWIGCQRFIYNAKVEEMRLQFKLRAIFMRDLCGPVQPVKFDQEYSRFTQGVDFLKAVPSQILRNGAYRFTQGVTRFKKGLSKPPTRKNKYGKQSVLVTRELFEIKGHTIHLGTQKCPVGAVGFHAALPFETPAMVSIAVEGNRWFLSFCHEDDAPEPMTHAQLLEAYSGLPAETLPGITIGVDRGVKINVAVSDHRTFHFSPEQVAALREASRKKKKYQRQMARRFKSGQAQSNNYYRAKASKQKAERKIRNIRKDFNHKTSRALVESSASVLGFEKLNLKGMTAAPKPKPDEASGEYRPNGAAAKAGLNRSILNAGMGQLIQFTHYKAIQKGKLVVQVPAHHSSQECSQCGFTHGDNRPTQAVFSCQNCGHTENADSNASQVVQKRTVRLLASGYFLETQKERKTCKVARNAARRNETSPASGSSRRDHGGVERHKETPPLAPARAG